jgi:NAD(P)H-dependent FMN reductase
VPGALKNALDWIVGSGELVDKPVALLNASPRATLAQASPTETIRVMSAHVVEEASLRIPLMGRNLDASGVAGDPELARLLAARSPNSQLRREPPSNAKGMVDRFDALATVAGSP